MILEDLAIELAGSAIYDFGKAVKDLHDAFLPEKLQYHPAFALKAELHEGFHVAVGKIVQLVRDAKSF